jgi:hypothetical protein
MFRQTRGLTSMRFSNQSQPPRLVLDNIRELLETPHTSKRGISSSGKNAPRRGLPGLLPCRATRHTPAALNRYCEDFRRNVSTNWVANISNHSSHAAATNFRKAEYSATYTSKGQLLRLATFLELGCDLCSDTRQRYVARQLRLASPKPSNLSKRRKS